MTTGKPVGSEIERRETPKPPQARRIFEASIPGLVHLAVLWLAFAVFEVALSALIPDTAIKSAQLSLGARLSLLAYQLAVLAAFLLPTGGSLLMVAVLGRNSGHHAIRWLLRGVLIVCAWVAVLLYGASWATFWNTGIFLDREAVAFMAPHPVQVFHWVYPPLALGVLAATFIVALAFSQWIPRWVEIGLPAVHRLLVLVAGAGVGVSVVGALLGGLAYGREPIKLGATRTPYALTRDNRAGPFARVLADLRERLGKPPERVYIVERDKVRILRRPIISMEEYLAGVRRSRIKRWNVVMVQVESLRSDQLRVYGGSREVMPALDALVRESRVFTDAYIQASHSNYADLVPLSSHYPLRSPRQYQYPEDPTYPRVLIYDVLKALGYRTAIFSSQNEHWGGMSNYHREGSLDRFFHAETFTGPTSAPWGDTGFAEWARGSKSAGSVDDRYTVEEAIGWIDSVAGNPFFLHMNLQNSHVPYVVPDEFPRRFSPKKLDFTIMWANFPRDKVDIVKAVYADSLAYIDTQIERLFQHLRRRGLWESTVIVVGGDNGEAFYEHGFAAHASSLYNEVMKVPMIIRAPGLAPGLDDRPAMFLDVPPSVFHLLGLPPHPSFQGISLFEPRPNPDRSIYMIVQTPMANQSAIVRSGFKLLFAEHQGYFLYDSTLDPGEKTNLAPFRPDLVKELAGRLQAWREEQLAYYSDVPRHSREYPPVLED